MEYNTISYLRGYWNSGWMIISILRCSIWGSFIAGFIMTSMVMCIIVNGCLFILVMACYSQGGWWPIVNARTGIIVAGMLRCSFLLPNCCYCCL